MLTSSDELAQEQASKAPRRRKRPPPAVLAVLALLGVIALAGLAFLLQGAFGSRTAPTPSPTLPPHVNPFENAVGYVDPDHRARREADARRGWDDAGAAALDKVASGPRAYWFTDAVPVPELAETVADEVSTQTKAGALPVLVAYAIPHRDCGNYSAGGVADRAGYEAWIEQFARGIGSRLAVVVLEPDGLALLDCLDPAAQGERLGMLADAVDVLEALPATAVYIDAGGPGWHPAEVMARRLEAAGISQARGFSINVSNFVDDAANVRYGTELSGLVGDKPFIVDTSRNGLGALPLTTEARWCNPPGRALGRRFTADTGSELVDAFTWIKAPGESDGTCGGGPPAGQWWTEYAIGLGQRTTW